MQRVIMMPPAPTAHLISTHAQILFALLKTRLNRPPHAADASQPRQREVWRCVAQVGFEFPRRQLTPQYQPGLRTGQAVTHRHHPQGPKVSFHRPLRALFDPMALPLSGQHLRRYRAHHLGLRLPWAKALASRLTTPTRPLGHGCQRTLEPHPRIMRDFGKIPEPTAGDRIEKRTVATKGFITRHPTRPHLLAIHDVANQVPAQFRFGAETQIAGYPALDAALGKRGVLNPFDGHLQTPVQQRVAGIAGIAQNTPAWQLARLPTSPQYCPLTPTDSLPCLRKPLPSRVNTASSSPRVSSTSRQWRLRMARSSQAPSPTNCCMARMALGAAPCRVSIMGSMDFLGISA